MSTRPKTDQDHPLTADVVLGVAAHPDDLDFSAAGTIAKLASQGAVVYYLLLTDGSKGSADSAADPAALIETRRQEQRAAAQLLGAKDVFFLNYEDGRLEVTADLKRDIIRHIRRLKPNTVICFDPSLIYAAEEGFINHPDHRACGQATLDAVFPLARDHLSFPELAQQESLAPHKVATLLLTNLEKHNYVVDISATLAKKLQAIAAHVSQVPDRQAVLERFTDRAVKAGLPYGFNHAEQFIRIDIPG